MNFFNYCLVRLFWFQIAGPGKRGQAPRRQIQDKQQLFQANLGDNYEQHTRTASTSSNGTPALITPTSSP